MGGWGTHRRILLAPFLVSRFPRPYRLHYTALLVCDVPYPVSLSCRDDNVAAPPVDLAVKCVAFVDLPSFRELDRAGFAVVEAVFAVNSRVGRGEDESGVIGGGGGGGGRGWFGEGVEFFEGGFEGHSLRSFCLAI